MAAWMGSSRRAHASRERRRKGFVDTPLSTGNPDFAPRLSDVSATANTPEAHTPADSRTQVGVTHAYVHWHDPDTVTVHPFKDTPLGDAA